MEIPADDRAGRRTGEKKTASLGRGKVELRRALGQRGATARVGGPVGGKGWVGIELRGSVHVVGCPADR